MQQEVCVVHLIWMPSGIQLFQEFVHSYNVHPAGHPHQLILLFNGVAKEEETVPYHHYIRQTGIAYQAYYYVNGQDLEVYQWIARQLFCKYILFVNSFSRFCINDWLQKFIQVYTPGVGLVSATGSWQSLYSNVFEKYSWLWTKSFTLKENIIKYKLLLKALFLWRLYFKPFPNPHVRTNSFFIDRALFASLQYKNPITKFDAYRIESGRWSITQQVLQKGLDVLVVDKFGNAKKAKHWITMKVFWSSNQENVLIADNQTNLYNKATTEEKRKMAYTAWRMLQ